MKTTLDGAIDCVSQLEAPHEQQVGLKFKRKVLAVLHERHFLKQRRAASRALEPAWRQVEAASTGQPPPEGERAPRRGQQNSEQQEEKRQDACRTSNEQTPLSTRALVMMEAERGQETHRLHRSQTASMSRARRQAAHLPADQQQRPLASMGQLEGFSGRPQPAGQFQARVPPARQEFYRFAVSSQPAKVLPNNTEVEDLCKCHANLLPKVTRATAKTVELFSACSPRWLGKRAAAKQPASDDTLNSEAIVCDEQHEQQEQAHEQILDSASAIEENVTKHSASRAGQIIRPNRGRRKVKFHVPESVLKLNTSLKPDDYNRGLCILTNDVRYQLHLLLYRRLQTIWTLFSTILCILVPILVLAALEPAAIAVAGLCWLALQTAGALLTRQFCARLDQMLEKAVAQVNSYFMDHNLMLGVINVGGLFARARLHVPLLYFDTSQCREQIESIISVDLRKKGEANDGPADKGEREAAPGGQRRRAANKPERKFAINYSKMGLRDMGLESQMSFAQSQLAKKIVLRYSQRWISFYDKQKLMFTDDTAKPRHLSTGKCLCQFIEEHFKYADFAEDAAPAAASQGQHDAPSSPATKPLEAKPDACMPLGRELDACKAAELVLQMPESAAAHEQEVEMRTSSPLGSIFWLQSQPSSDLSFQQQLDLLVPTLSHLVSSRNHSKESAQQGNASELNPLTRSHLVGGLGSLQQRHHYERLEWNSSPTTERSLDLTEASDSTLASIRNEELIKRLKLLLDSRKDEFARGLDGAANHQTNLVSRSLSIVGDKSTLNPNTRQMSQSSSSQTISMQDEMNNNNNNNNNSSPISQLGKRFFSQTDGSFFLGSKKSHEGVYGKQQQILEIC